MRAAFSESLIELAKNDPKVLLLTGDHGYELFDKFRIQYPAQYINAGIAEQNMVGMAAGLAKVGFRPFVYGLSAFIPVRVIEQIKLDIAHDNLPVVLIGDGAGFVYSHLGTSHQSTEDIACTRSIPNISIFSPSDRFEVTACMAEMYRSKSTCYIRLGKSDRGDVHTSDIINPLCIQKVREGSANSSVTIVATGSMVVTALKLASTSLLTAEVWSAPCLKPFDVVNLSRIVDKPHRTVVVLEEHSIYGGLGSIVAELAAEYGTAKVLRLGVKDRFSDMCGSYDYLLREHGLDISSVVEQTSTFFNGIENAKRD